MSQRDWLGCPRAMRISLLLGVALVGCSAGLGGGADGGNGSGNELIESDCTGVPAHLAAVDCTQATVERCAASASAMRQQHSGICQPGTQGGGVSTSSCGGFEVVAHTSTVSTVECFYGADGGSLSGALNFADASIGAWGTVADCNRSTPVACDEVCGALPSHVATATCIAPAAFAECGADFDSVNVPIAVDCDAAHGIFGHAAEGSCGDVKALRWTYGQPGDTRECFYAADGGAFVGGLNFTDRGVVFATGTTASCTWAPTAGCDGGMR